MAKSTNNSQFSIATDHGVITGSVMWYHYDTWCGMYDMYEHDFMFRGVFVRGCSHIDDFPNPYHIGEHYTNVLHGPASKSDLDRYVRDMGSNMWYPEYHPPR